MVNYSPVSLLPICGKVFNRLTSPNQSCFRPKDSCENQLQLYKFFMQILVKVFHLKEEQTFYVFQRSLIKFNKTYILRFWKYQGITQPLSESS